MSQQQKREMADCKRESQQEERLPGTEDYHEDVNNDESDDGQEEATFASISRSSPHAQVFGRYSIAIVTPFHAPQGSPLEALKQEIHEPYLENLIKTISSELHLTRNFLQSCGKDDKLIGG